MNKVLLNTGAVTALFVLAMLLSGPRVQAEELAPKNLGFSYNLPKGWKSQIKTADQSYIVSLTNPKMKYGKLELWTIPGSFSNNVPLSELANYFEKNIKWEGFERKNIQKREIFIDGIKALHVQFDLYKGKKKMEYGEMIYATRRNTAHIFIFRTSLRYQSLASKAFREVINSLRLSDFEKMTKHYFGTGAGISFEYPALWPNPIFEKTSSGKTIAYSGLKWTVVVFTACYDCEVPIGFPIFIEKFDAKKSPLSAMLITDKAEILSKKSEKNLETIKTKGEISKAKHFIYYLIRGDEILRMSSQAFTMDDMDLVLKNLQF